MIQATIAIMVGVALGVLIHFGLKDLNGRLSEVQSEVAAGREDVEDVRERMARFEGLVEGIARLKLQTGTQKN